MTPELVNVIDNLKQKVETIKSLYSNALNENKQLKEEINKLTAQNDSKEKQNEHLEKKYESLKLAKIIAASSTDAHDAKIKLNRIVREIDKCISLLNK